MKTDIRQSETATEAQGQASLAAATGSADLADKIARDIFAEGDERTPCQRIQFMGGTYPDGETNQGGYCEAALANALRKILARHLPNVVREPSRTHDSQQPKTRTNKVQRPTGIGSTHLLGDDL
jgi:hypothetical protein